MDLEGFPVSIDPEMQALPTYNRKEKSLGLLCENFLSLYGTEEETECISLDEAASRLGVERRRIYDIVNILESVEVLVRKAKNCYIWYGFARLPQALKEMKEAALREYGVEGLPRTEPDEDNPQYESATGTQEPVNVPIKLEGSYDESYNFYKPKTKADCRREKSLGLLSQKFVQLFLISQSQVVSLDEAAKILFGGCNDPSKLKTKVRRLYDIANVLTSLQLIEKTHGTENRKPAFKWLGVRENGVPFRKRQFGSCRPNSADPPVVKRPAMKRAAAASEQTGGGGGLAEMGDGRCPVHAAQLGIAAAVQYQNETLNNMFAHYVDYWRSMYFPGQRSFEPAHNHRHASCDSQK